MSTQTMPLPFNPADIKALALDLDGTMLGPGAVLSGRTLRVLAALRGRGIQLIIATGRAVEAAEKYRVPLGADGPMVYFNGALVADMPEGRVLDSTLMDPGVADFCVDISRRRNVYFQVYFPGTAACPGSRLLAEWGGPERDMYHNHTGMLAEIGDLKEALTAPGLRGCIKGMFLTEPETQNLLRAEVEERFGNSVYIAQTLRTFLEVMDARVSKGEGLKKALAYRGLKAAEVIAFGDEENDLPLFAAAGFSVAPANAKDSVKAAANVVTGSNAEDGVASWLEEIGL
ncbi:haloacid dehalogenase [Spirochaetia bacterium]|nr:haloacid dehalogenase [Spirochaetia bacterium]